MNNLHLQSVFENKTSAIQTIPLEHFGESSTHWSEIHAHQFELVLIYPNKGFENAFIIFSIWNFIWFTTVEYLNMCRRPHWPQAHAYFGIFILLGNEYTVRI